MNERQSFAASSPLEHPDLIEDLRRRVERKGKLFVVSILAVDN